MAIASVYTSPATGFTLVTTTDLALTPPTSTAAVGNVAIVACSIRSISDFITGVSDTATGTKTFTKLRFGAQNANASSYIFYRVLQSGDPGVGNVNTWTVTKGGNSVALAAALLCYSGTDTTTPIDAQGTTFVLTTPVTFNSVTTTVAAAMFIGVACTGSTNAAFLTAQTAGTPTLTERVDFGNAGGTTTRTCLGVVDGTISAAGATGNYTWTVAQASSSDTFALRPAAAVAAAAGQFFITV